MKASGLTLALIFASPILATPVFAQDPGLFGAWVGVGRQDGETWDMTVDVVQGGARVDYPGFPCGGLWVFFDVNAATVKGTEWLTYGKDQCLDGLGLTMARGPGGELSIRWYDDAGAEVAQADLHSKPTSSGRKSSTGSN
jgi:hypothetical protein